MRRLLHYINELNLRWFVIALFAVILVFALGYWWLALHGQLLFTWETETTPGPGDALYFSIVTISSLGYGDIRPVGWARVLVSLEVIVGLAFFGMLVAKVSSVKQDYILRRMYSDLVDDKLAKFARQLEEMRQLYRNTSLMLLAGDLDPQLTTTFRRDTPGSTFFSQFRQLLSDVRDVVVAENYNHALFGEVPDSRIETVYDDIRGILRRTTLLWQNDPVAARSLVLEGNGEELDHICRLTDELAHLALRDSKNPDIAAMCRSMLEISARIRAEILTEI